MSLRSWRLGRRLQKCNRRARGTAAGHRLLRRTVTPKWGRIRVAQRKIPLRVNRALVHEACLSGLSSGRHDNAVARLRRTPCDSMGWSKDRVLKRGVSWTSSVHLGHVPRLRNDKSRLPFKRCVCPRTPPKSLLDQVFRLACQALVRSCSRSRSARRAAHRQHTA